jgi:hypothetical protein
MGSSTNYQISTRVATATCGITGAPKNPDDSKFIVRLVGHVVPAMSLPNALRPHPPFVVRHSDFAIFPRSR